MELHFYKYQGTGNDFIIIDNREKHIRLSKEQIASLCDRHMGIGADGLMLLERKEGYDFHMVYYNADGGESSMCGNGGRCMTAFAKKLGLVKDHTSFTAIDGVHSAKIESDGTVALHMKEVNEIQILADHCILDTGSPHYVLWVNDVAQEDVYGKGKEIRYREAFAPGGINVNFAERDGKNLKVRTYERGVEDETLSCGTGVCACAIAAIGDETGHFEINVDTPGGKLKVSFDKESAGTANNVVLSGAATFVFEGSVAIS